MRRRTHALMTAAALASILFASARPDRPTPVTVNEARARARLLHGAIHDTLQIVHARYFREDEGLAIPAASLETVFEGTEQRSGIRLRWLAVEGRTMNVDHAPRDDFEKAAAKALAAGKDEYELADGSTYRYAGPITLRSECLKCHLPSRSSNDSRTAGLLIAVPLEAP